MAEMEPQEERNGFDPKRYRALFIWLALLLIVFILIAYNQEDRGRRTRRLAYSELVEHVRAGDIRTMQVEKQTDLYRISGQFHTEGKGLDAPTHYIAQADERAQERIRQLADDHNIKVKFNERSRVFEHIVALIPYILIFVIIYFFFIRQMRGMGGGGVLSFGKSRATRITRDKMKKTFEDVAGIDEAKEEVCEIIEFLRDPERFRRLGGRMPRGCLLIGGPGTGKTLLAKAIAGEADVPFFSISGSDFVEMFVGVGASRVRDLFEQAKTNAPCIIFLDEIDAVGRKRGTGFSGGHDEREQTLNAILVEMDGFDTDENVIVMAATNRPDVLDKALLRPGRFDRRIYVDPPDLKGREAILKVHARRVTMAEAADLSRVARGTPGFSGADLENLINEAAILAAMKDKDAVEMEDLEEARDKVLWGKEKRSRAMTEEDRRVTAIHEAGHALVNQVLDEVSPLHKVTIIQRGRALGATMQLPEKDEYNVARKRVYGDIKLLFAGRVAEELFCQDITSGAANDLERATELARSMVCEWGMSEELGLVHYGQGAPHPLLGESFSHTNYSEATARRIDTEVRRIVDECYRAARSLIEEHREQLQTIADALLEFEVLTGDEVKELIEGGQIDSLRKRRKDAAEKEVKREAQSGEEHIVRDSEILKQGDSETSPEGVAPGSGPDDTDSGQEAERKREDGDEAGDEPRV